MNKESFKKRIQVQTKEIPNVATISKSKHYAMSDIHGIYASYAEAIEKLEKDDHIFIIGDVIDRGPDGIKIILDIMKRQKDSNSPQITFLLGNHEIMFLQTIKIMLDRGLNRDDIITLMECDNFVSFFDNVKNKGVSLEEAYVINNWIKENRGDKTIFSYLEEVEPSTRKKIYMFLLDSNVILPQKIGNQDFLFVHSMPINNQTKLEEMKKTGIGYKINELTLKEYRFMVAERQKESYKQAQEVGFITICGHTPKCGTIINNKEEGFIRIDAGCGHHKPQSKLALYCIEDDRVEYIDEKSEIDVGEPR